MATGVGMGFDLEGLDKAIKNAEKGFDNLIKKGQKTQEAIVNNFRIMAEEGVGYFASKLNGISSAFENFGKSASKGMQDIASSSSSAVDKVNHLIDMVKGLSYSDYKGQSYSSGAVAKLTYEIEEAMKKLAQLQEKLNFYATGEGAKAIGFYDTSKIVEEANALQRYIELLQQERHELQQIANIKGFQAEQQAKIDAEWQRMEDERIGNIRESAKASSEAAKAESAAWKQSYEEAYRAYERLFDKADEREYAELFKKAEANLRQMQKAEAERYSDWLLQKKREEEEHKRIEDEKYKSTVEAIAKQNAAYAELENRRQQNQQVQDNAVQARANYEATIRMYEQMYAQIDTKEKEKERRYLETQKREEEAAARKAKSVIDQTNRELEAYRNAYKQRQQMYEQLWNEYDNTPTGALGAYNQLYSPQGVKSLNEMRTVLKQLETAQANINRATKEGQEDWEQVGNAIKRVSNDIQRAEKEMGKFHNRQKGVLDTSGQLKRALAGVFSVSAIKGYINKLIDVRGEFELQQRSLQVLLQNKEEADALWDKTVALAVKSPFTTKELVTYTKQLAAYRVESDKLYETNKMLADVSAGLGVDMNRLILAFGQVKAANFLRGTELRQFSEAGVNMLEELSKRFEKLEGKAVSVGDVFERVSKRMVSFKDVEAVFQTITSEGGMFYQMQEKQSETLKGMMLNLRDSYDLMLNSIGEKNNSTIKSIISSIKSVVDNWETYANVVIPILEAFLVRMAILKATPYFKNIIDGFNTLTRAIKVSIKRTNGLGLAFKTLGKSNIIGWILTISGAVAGMVANFASATDNAGKFAAKMAKFKTETKKLVDDFKELSEAVNDSTKSTEEQNKAYDKLIDVYKDYLPSQALERDNIDELTKRQDQYIARLERIREIKEKEYALAQSKNIYEYEEEQLRDIFGIFELYDKNFKPIEAFQKIYELEAEVEKGAKSAKEAYEEFEAWISGFDVYSFTSGNWWGDLFSLKGNTSGWSQFKGQIKAIFNPADYIDWGKSIEDRFNAIGTVVDDYSEIQDTATERFNEFKKSIESSKPKNLEEYNKNLKKINDEIKGIGEGVINLGEGTNFYDAINAGVHNALWGWVDNARYKEKLEAYLKEKQSDINEAVYKAYEDIQKEDKTLKGALDNVIKDKFEKDSESSSDDWAKELKQEYDAATKILDAKKRGGAVFDKMYKPEEVKQAKAIIKLYEKLFGIPDKKKNKEDSEELKRLKEQIRLIQNLADDYRKLRLERGKAYADANIKDQGRREAFVTAGLNLDEMHVGLNDEEIKNLNTLKPIAEKITGGMVALGSATADANTEIGNLEQQIYDLKLERALDDLFGNYELSLELDELNLPKNLFGVQTIELADVRFEGLEKVGLGDLSELTDEQILQHEKFIALNKAQQNAISDHLNKVADMERKAQEKMLKTYSKYLVQAQSERVKILLEEKRQLEEISKLDRSEEEKALMRQGVEKDTKEKLDKQEWKDFQNSGMYLRLFENLEGASMQSLNNMETKLKSLRASLTQLDPTELKEINAQLEKINELKIAKNPFKGLKEDAVTFFEYLKNKKDWEESLAFSERMEDSYQQVIDQKQLELDEDEKKLGILKKNTGEQSLAVIIQQNLVDAKKKELKILLDSLEAQKLITKEERKRLEGGEDSKKSLKDRFSEASEYAYGIANSLGSMTESLESAFGMSDGLKDTLEVISGVGMGLGDMFSGASGIMSGNPLQMIQGGMSVISGFSKVIGSFNAAYDKKRERKIQKEIKLVERLDKLYSELKERVDNAFTFDALNKATTDTQENLEEQIRSYNRMITAEEDKKDTDHERIAEWRNEIDELNKQIKELENQRIQALGGIGGEANYKSMAESFTDAWLEAFMETGDGLAALEDSFDDFITDLVKKQLSMRVAGALLSPLQTYIDQAVGDDGVFDANEFKDTMELAKEIFPDFNEKMKEALEAMGMTDWAGQQGELGTLQAGIQGVSEQTADIIASYLNSIRFFVADSNTQLKTLVAAQGIDTDAPNPMLSQLLVIAEQTRAIRDLFDSVVVGGHKMGRSGIKVFID